jgi:hypothetical protein
MKTIHKQQTVSDTKLVIPVNVALFRIQQHTVPQPSSYSSYIKLPMPNHGCSEKILLTQSNVFLSQNKERNKQTNEGRKNVVIRER